MITFDGVYLTCQLGAPRLETHCQNDLSLDRQRELELLLQGFYDLHFVNTDES